MAIPLATALYVVAENFVSNSSLNHLSIISIPIWMHIYRALWPAAFT